MSRRRRAMIAFALTAFWVTGGAVLAQPVGDGPTSQPAATSAVAAATPLERANADAVARLEAQIAGERFDANLTIGQLLDRVDGRPLLVSGLTEAEQVGGPRYVTGDLVQVQRQISGGRVANLLRQAVDANPDRCPVSRDRLDALLAPWEGKAFASTGTSAHLAHTSDQTTTPAIAIPDRAPAWTIDPIVTSARAAPAGSQLRTARAAERDARGALRKRVERLALDDKHSLGDLAAANPVVRDLLGRALDDARVAGVNYEADGSVEIRVSLDGQRLWQTLQLAR